MKKGLFLLFTMIVILLSSSQFSFNITLLGPDKQILGMVAVPVFEIILGLIYVIAAHKIWHLNFGFNIKKMNFTCLTLLPVVVTVIANIITSKSLNIIFHKLPSGQLFLGLVTALLSAIIVGFFEEIIIRGGLFNYCLALFSSQKYKILWSGIISSLIFGSLHLGNYFLGNYSLEYTLYQVVYASMIGFFILHDLIDWSDLFFNLAGEPTLLGIQWVPISLTIIYAICGCLIYLNLQTTNFKNIGLEN